MTEIHPNSGVRIHQMRESYHSSCNSTLSESYPIANGSSVANKNAHRNPLLQTIVDHSSLGSANSSSTTTTATDPTIGWAKVGTNGLQQKQSNSSDFEIQFDEREIYYVSPTKRKNNFFQRNSGPSSDVMRQSKQQQQQQCFKRSSNHLNCQLQNPPHPATTVAPSAKYGFRAAGKAHDLSFDNYEVSSHLSDTAMQVLRSGSCSGDIGSNNLIMTDGGGSGSSSSSLQRQHQQHEQHQHQQQQQQVTPPAARSTNNVTFSNCIVEEQKLNSIQQQHHNRGSLRRSKGRSNQSLCSCDAGADTEIIPDPVRPLYQYSLERRSKRQHTYTCEQNAQILMRLERERNRKLSSNNAGAVEGDSSGIHNSQSDAYSLSDGDVIPPVPPPPRKSNQQRHQYHNRDPESSNTKTPLCHGDILNDCAESAIEVGSLLDDCATTIIKCANVVGSEILAAAAIHSKTSSSTTATAATVASMSAANVKPDVCHVNNRTDFRSNRPLCIRDDIFIPNSKKSDPSLCFLHTGVASIANDSGPYPFTTLPYYKVSQQNRSSSLGKYNTIGPSSNYAKQLATYQYLHHQQQQKQQQQQQQQMDNQSHVERCRCLSQSLSNFSTGVIGGVTKDLHHHYQDHRTDDRNGYPMDSMYHIDGYSHWHPNDAPAISRSIGNLLDVDSNIPYHPYNQFQTPANVFSSSSCSFGAATNLINSSFTTLGSSSSGLKEKFHEQQQKQQKQLQQQHDGSNHHHHHQQKHHHLNSSTMSIMPWKHRQCPSRGSSSSGTNSLRFDAAKHWLAVSSILLIIGAASVAVPLALRVAASAPFEERLRVAAQLLDQVPLIDGHNDLPWNIRKFLHNKLNDFNFDEDLRNVMPWARSQWSHTDLQRLKKGRISAQFWAAYVPCEAQHRDAVQLTLEQIDVIKRLTERYSPQLTTCTSAADIIEAHKNHQLCSLTGVEGGHSLGGSLAVLRTLYAIGVRYMTLTSTCHTPWADSSYADAPTFNIKHGGLTIFGKTIIREMNRLGMMVDLSHVSTGTMRDALEVTEAPVIFSHSSAYELCNSSRNVQDDMLQSLAKNGGLVMVNFYSKFLSCSENSTVHDAVAHINHIKRVAGIDHVGLGAGFDGINFTPKGLEDVSSYPTLFAELLGVGWSIEDLTKLAGGNFIRVMQQVEKIRDLKKSSGIKPFEDHPNFRTDDPYNCTSS